MKVLITGITGFVGRHLARDLLAAGHEVFGASTEPAAIEGVSMIEADVTDPAAVHRMIADSDPEAILHLAGLSHVGESWKRPGDYLTLDCSGVDGKAGNSGGMGAR